ncbi:MAG: ATP-binding cassette domain-containing protein [Bacteroidota bacterium]
MTPTLEFDSIQLEYDFRQVLASVYMRCNVGEIVGLLGRNGSGKSSLMKIVFGTLSCPYRSVRINGRALTNSSSQKHIGYLPQHHFVPPFLSVREALKIFRLSPDWVVEKIPEAENWLTLKPRQLSGGNLRLVETLLILGTNTKFCILDEPFSGLAPLYIRLLHNIICEERERKGILITDHLYRQVTAVSDRLYVLVNGKTYLVQHPDELISFGYTNAL